MINIIIIIITTTTITTIFFTIIIIIYDQYYYLKFFPLLPGNASSDLSLQQCDATHHPTILTPCQPTANTSLNELQSQLCPHL